MATRFGAGTASSKNGLCSCSSAAPHTKTETQGLVLLEAMAQGVPVVAIPRMGTIDILGPGLGCRHAPNDRKGFAEVVRALLADGGARRELGVQAREYAETWASARMAQRLSALYASLAPAVPR